MFVDLKTDALFSHAGSSNFFLIKISFSSGEWEHWNKRVEEYIYPKDHNPDFLSILVPNVDNVRTDYLIHIVSNQGKVCILLMFLFVCFFVFGIGVFTFT